MIWTLAGLSSSEKGISISNPLKGNQSYFEQGDRVTDEQPIARVGNTGNTMEPHLHVHAVTLDEHITPEYSGKRHTPLGGDPVPLLIKGEFPMRNSTFGR